MPSTPFRIRTATLADRIDACSALSGLAREQAALGLYTELCNTRDLTVAALDWRALGIELAVTMRAYSAASQPFEFLRARSVDCHRRADVARQIAVQVEVEQAYEAHEGRTVEVPS